MNTEINTAILPAAAESVETTPAEKTKPIGTDCVGAHEPTLATPKVSDKERSHYARAWEAGACNFQTPEREYEWAINQCKKCTKCYTNKPLTDFMNNTSGRDAFDKNKYRLRRPECRECNKSANKGKNQAIKLAKENGISLKAPDGTECELCGKTTSIVFDHDHVNNVFRGWLCDPCNRSMGVLGDSAQSILSAVAYLAKNNASAQDIITQLRTAL